MKKNQSQPPSRYARKRYLIEKGFQIKYTLMVIAFMFLIAWLAGYTVYYTLFTLLGEKLANVYPQGRLMAIFKTVNATLFIRILLLIPFVTIISILLSHRIVGPVYRVRRYLSEVVAKGDFSAVLKLRKRDEFKNLAEAINNMTQDLGKAAGENRQIADKLGSMTDELNTELEQASPDTGKIGTLAKEIAYRIKDLKAGLDKYRVGKDV